MFGLGLPELLIVMVIIIIVFGAGRIGKIAGEMGSGIRAFREGIASKDTEKPADEPPVDKTES